MWFHVGTPEVLFLGILALAAVAASLCNRSRWRWSVPLFCGFLVAAVISPADLVSTIVLGAVIAAFFLLGMLGSHRRLAA